MTQSTRHKWADVIIAFAEGKDIQFKNADSDWITAVNLSSIGCTHLQWRIKPEVKTGWINIYPRCSLSSPDITSDVSAIYSTKEFADAGAGVQRIACVPIQYYEGEGL